MRGKGEREREGLGGGGAGDAVGSKSERRDVRAVQLRLTCQTCQCSSLLVAAGSSD